DGARQIGTLIFDPAVLKDDAEISVSNSDGSQLQTLPVRLKLPESMRRTLRTPHEKGNEVVQIHNAYRIIGATRQSLGQIELKTDRPFPARDTALQLHVGRRFFLRELSGDLTGRSLTLTLSPEQFAGLNQGDQIVAFFNRPDRSGLSSQDIWYFGRLDKQKK